MKLVEGEMYQCKYETQLAPADNRLKSVLVHGGDLVIYVGIQQTEYYEDPSHVFYHQKSMSYIAWSILVEHHIDGYFMELTDACES